MIRINSFIKVSAENRDQVIADALLLVENSLKEPGCIAYDIFSSLSRDNVLMFCETWKDEAALEAHRKTPHYAQYVTNIRELARVKGEHFTF